MPVDVPKSFQADEEAYRHMREQLLMEHKGKWAAIHNGKVVAAGEGQSEVIKKAFSTVGDSSFHVNKVGEVNAITLRLNVISVLDDKNSPQNLRATIYLYLLKGVSDP